jgi:HD domain
MEPILGALDAPDLLAAAVAAEPPPRITVPARDLDRVCSAFACFADLKGRFLLGHSAHVAGLADRAAVLIGCDDEGRSTVRAAALLLDLGRVGVSSAVWDRPGQLGPVEWERVRLHSYWTERILMRCPPLARLAPLAAAHHERLDGSGYHRAAKGSELSIGGRLLAAADVFAAMTEPRPHREAHSRSEAARASRPGPAERYGCSRPHSARGRATGKRWAVSRASARLIRVRPRSRRRKHSWTECPASR